MKPWNNGAHHTRSIVYYRTVVMYIISGNDALLQARCFADQSIALIDYGILYLNDLKGHVEYRSRDRDK